jgi:hypothetical protein
MRQLTCSNCGKTFHRYDCHVNPGDEHFCALTCKSTLYQRRRNTPMTAEFIRNIMNYDQETGEFSWREGRRFRGVRAAPGESVGRINNIGYVTVTICNIAYFAHRLAWLYVHGEWPADVIDHRDGNPSNNAFSNLRAATQAQNSRNRRKSASSASRFKGISKSNSNYRAYIMLDNVHTYLGTYQTQEEAHAVYRAAAEKLHGEFARFE